MRRFALHQIGRALGVLLDVAPRIGFRLGALAGFDHGFQFARRLGVVPLVDPGDFVPASAIASRDLVDLQPPLAVAARFRIDDELTCQTRGGVRPPRGHTEIGLDPLKVFRRRGPVDPGPNRCLVQLDAEPEL